MEKNGDGIVYILTNEAMPGYVKIGKTTTSVEDGVLSPKLKFEFRAARNKMR